MTLPANKWPYGPPAYHQPCCVLFDGKDYCDCLASDAEDTEWGLDGNYNPKIHRSSPRERP